VAVSFNNPLGWWQPIGDIVRLDPPKFQWMLDKIIADYMQGGRYEEEDVLSKLHPHYFTYILDFERKTWIPICANLASNLCDEDEFRYDELLNCELTEMLGQGKQPMYGQEDEVRCSNFFLEIIDITKTNADEGSLLC
jgi:hypothetical protein